MKSHFDPVNTKKLQKLISSSFMLKQAMDLVHSYANPRVFNSKGDSLLHIFVTQMDTPYIKMAVRELVKEYKVDINIKNKKGEAPLEQLMKGAFNNEHADYLIRLGADVGSAATILQTAIRGFLAKQSFFIRQQKASEDAAAQLTRKFMQGENPHSAVIELREFTRRY